jgi:K+-transporting ATPase KdpF subunit
MSAANAIALVTALGIVVYLVVALVFPEKF